MPANYTSMPHNRQQSETSHTTIPQRCNDKWGLSDVHRKEVVRILEEDATMRAEGTHGPNISRGQSKNTIHGRLEPPGSTHMPGAKNYTPTHGDRK